MRKWTTIIKISFGVTVCLLFSGVPPSHAQQAGTEATEVYLTFRYRGIVNVYVTSYYKDNQFYLPVSELFNSLQIQHQVDQGSLTISGNYLGEKEYQFDFKTQVARAGDTEIQLQADDFIIPGIDYFVKPSIFEELFGLTFTTNFNNLTLDLQTEDRLPVVAQYEREQERQQLDRDKPLYDRTFYPLKYDREYGTVDGGFLDYNLSAIYTGGTPLFTFSNAIGAEILAGDLQGSLFGALSGQQQSFTTSGLRWRYVQRNNSYFSSAIVGQTNSEGFGNRAFRGVKISNKPVEPRQLFDRYVIDGNTTPQSEVELYLNNSLVDFQEADESGNYRFVVPLTYGSTNYSLRIYTPSGQAIERNSRIQVPFDYIPKGEVDYSISAGELSNPILGFSDAGYMADASVSAGLSNWLTAQASTEYLTQFHNTIPSFTGTLNARLFTNYLLSASANSENFYRLSSSVVYSSGASWSLSYDYNPGQSLLYNVGGSDHQARLNIFTPFKIGNTPLNIRWSSTYRQNVSSSLLRYRADLSTRFNRLNVRFGYQDQQSGALSLITTQSSRITNSYTYSVGRSANIPGLLRQMFIRGNISYLPGLREFEEVEFQLSRNIFETGRFQFTFGHNFLGDFNSVGLNVTIDFDKFRSNSSATSNGSQMSFTQNIRGSVGYDGYGEQLILNNRQQVGQAGTAVRLFLDNNNDGSYQKETDEIIRDPAVRLNRSGGRTQVQNGINYISQLLPYYRYDIEINKSALSNPLLVPDSENFSIVTDPNQFKPVEIPFYLSGVISGRVERLRIDGQDSTRSGLSGVRLFLESDYKNPESREAYSEEIRTFSDGSFYTYEVPPGKYNLFVDPNQLQFLGGEVKPDTMQFEIEALSEGDFIENLLFTVKPKGEDTVDSSSKNKAISANNNQLQDTTRFKVQIASYRFYSEANRAISKAENQTEKVFYIRFNPNAKLYGIESMPVVGQQTAINMLKMIRSNSIFNNPVLVLIDKTDKSYSLQLGMFSSQSDAEKFIEKINDVINIRLFYYKDPEDKLFKVVTDNIANDIEIKQEIEGLNSNNKFVNPLNIQSSEVIVSGSYYTFEIKVDNPESIKFNFLEGIPGLHIKTDSQNDVVTISGFSSWRHTLEIQAKLKDFNSNIDPIIILKKNRNVQTNSN